MKDLIKKYIKDFVKEYEKQESISLLGENL